MCWKVLRCEYTVQFTPLILFTQPPVVCGLEEDTVEVSGGGLGFVYSTLQLHFHWASALHSGSEHTLDTKRYPMEVATNAEVLSRFISRSLSCCAVFEFSLSRCT